MWKCKDCGVSKSSDIYLRAQLTPPRVEVGSVLIMFFRLCVYCSGQTDHWQDHPAIATTSAAVVSLVSLLRPKIVLAWDTGSCRPSTWHLLSLPSPSQSYKVCLS